MEEKYINKILNFADENINTAKELVINKEQAKGIIKELQEDYIPVAIINLQIAELKEKIKSNEKELKKKNEPVRSGFYSFDDYFRWKNEVLKENELNKYMIKILNKLYKNY